MNKLIYFKDEYVTHIVVIQPRLNGAHKVFSPIFDRSIRDFVRLLKCFWHVFVCFNQVTQFVELWHVSHQNKICLSNV